MKIRNEILEMVRKSTDIRRELGRQLNLSDASISRHIKENRSNGEFTKAIAVRTIASKLSLPESLVLE